MATKVLYPYSYVCTQNDDHEVRSTYALVEDCPVYVFGSPCGGGLTAISAPARTAAKDAR